MPPMARTPRSPSSQPATPPRAARPVDGLTTAEGEGPYPENPALLAREERFAAESPDQLPLFAPGPAGALRPALGGLPPLSAGSSPDLARSWYRRELGQAGRPSNTVESYFYDLV